MRKDDFSVIAQSKGKIEKFLPSFDEFTKEFLQEYLRNQLQVYLKGKKDEHHSETDTKLETKPA